tara:strand:+ start:90 stop:272 length:183 start_codon:yes stop_codon:yes gene_type:complete
MYKKNYPDQKLSQLTKMPESFIDNDYLNQMVGGEKVDNKVIVMSSISGRCTIRCTFGCNP